ncbi:MAG: DegT/DnrJ/EryC1/StrS family aminotransferase [Flavobacteriaceae bacterium]|nr:DegT/DnrJ/EryC1/StrS family aminotransferase [Flavobacteriaceae bacterium]
MKYSLATSSWGDEEIKAMQSVIESDMYSMGPKVAKYEKEFSSYFGAKHAVMCSSGSTANLIMTAALFYTKTPRLKIGDEIIVPAVSWSTTYFPLQQYGLKLKFVDIDAETLNYNLSDLKEAITKQTKAVMAVNLLGNSNDFDAIFEIIDEKDIVLIEDNCESMGAKYNGKYTGTFGVMGSFSSFFSHHISTMEGGMVVTDDEELYHVLLCLRAHGWTRNLPRNNHVFNKSDNWFEEAFRFVLPGYNVRPLEMSGAIGSEQLLKLDGFINQRRKNAEHFITLFKDDNRFIIQKELGESSWFGFSFIIKDLKLNREKIIEVLTKANIDSRPIVTGDFTKNEVMRFFDYDKHNSLPNADQLHYNGFFVGNSQEPLISELDYLKEVLSNV